MFYDAIANTHGLRHDPWKALVGPRPIGWISSLSPTGVANLAPYSFFNAVGEKPNYVMFSSSGRKDSLENIVATREFVCSLATFDLRSQMNTSAAPVPPEIDEFEITGLTKAPCRLVKPPRVAESPAAFECRLHTTLDLPPGDRPQFQHTLVIGLVVGIHIADSVIVDGRVDTGAMRPIARLGYMDYAVVTPETVFQMPRPETAEEVMAKRAKG